MMEKSNKEKDKKNSTIKTIHHKNNRKHPKKRLIGFLIKVFIFK